MWVERERESGVHVYVTSQGKAVSRRDALSSFLRCQRQLNHMEVRCCQLTDADMDVEACTSTRSSAPREPLKWNSLSSGGRGRLLHFEETSIPSSSPQSHASMAMLLARGKP